MKKCIEGSEAVATVIASCEPDVVSSYPITPQTHIIEDLAWLKNSGQVDFEFIRADSEFAAASIVQGASAAGGRTYTATSSQGLLLMMEVIYATAGLRLPVVMTLANRAVSAPINIWNDQQDAMSMRDAGWIMLFAEDNQAAVDLHVLAYKMAEKLRVPAVVNMDGFVLTHTVEPIDLPTKSQVKTFLPKYKPSNGTILDVKNPVTLGAFATPEYYQEFREDLQHDLLLATDLLIAENKKFKKIFNREYQPIEYYGVNNPEAVILTFGSLVGTVKDVVDDLNKQKKKVGVVNVVMFRPFPQKELISVMKKVKWAAVVEKDIAFGSTGGLDLEVKAALFGKSPIQVDSYSMGLGGRDITKAEIEKIFTKMLSHKRQK
ncbi:pyruvate ferredoxin oxidoreductase [Candidatus Falkowbacteria bacterium CG10_big_fil_rev_8_21_14_0_10_39_11]|uniref:Pyruvate ferredoxin oxidoreductase n=1 Tax=Candidatus Falkowbacteria bacterium CG10_big_fil_rev_8_21_14_0_10_39_11 TaxID=1974565 RepID=A0A2H0V7M2_9BACT|nr:MAG: pyruvate ferredoxin oxidoreductase [Candidatus Falkowbacteria bacterium CG10_big_fil_rev_8_21_14_0_10_39_11]